MSLRYVVRLLPGGPFLVSSALGVAWAFGTRIDTGTEGTVLAVITTVALSLVVGDEAAPVTGPSPVPLSIRRRNAATVAVAVAAVIWAVIRLTAPSVFDGAHPLRWWDALEWTTIAVSQLAAGSVVAHRRGEASVGPGLVTGLVWTITTSMPSVHQRLFDVEEHAGVWFAIVVALSFIVAVAAIDPASRHSPYR